MGSEKHIKIHNKSDKPDNVVLNEHDLVSRCEDLEKQLPSFLRGFFAYLRGNVLPRPGFHICAISDSFVNI